MVNSSADNQMCSNEDQFNYKLFLSHRNRYLAKELTKQKLIAKQYLDEKNNLEKKHYSSLVLNLKYESLHNKLLNQSKQALNHCVGLSTSLAQIIELSLQSAELKKSSNDDVQLCYNCLSHRSKKRSITPTNKTHAVQPMVDGHVIGSLRINLERIGDIDRISCTNTDSGSSASDSNSENNVAQRPGNFPTGSITNSWLNIPQANGLLTNYLGNEIDDNAGDEANMDPVVVLEKQNLDRWLGTIHELRESLNSSNASNSLTEDQESNATVEVEEKVSNNNDPLLQKSSQQCSSVPRSVINGNTTSSSCDSYNPLEGPSNLLDDDGYFNRRRNRRKMINYNETDSPADDSSEDKGSSNLNDRFYAKSKRKTMQCDDDDDRDDDDNFVNGIYQSKKINNTRKRLKENRNKKPIVVLTKIPDRKPEETVDNENSNHRPKRNKLRGTLKEASLRRKLRREK